MVKLEFSMNLPSDSKKLMEIGTNYEILQKFAPVKLLKIRIIERNEEQTIIEETLSFSFFNYQILQKSLHKQIKGDTLETEIISGPFEGTIIQVLYEKISTGTKVTVNADLKLCLKYMILSHFIKQRYRVGLKKVLIRMNKLALVTHGRPLKDSLMDNDECLIIPQENSMPIKLYGWWLGDPNSVFLDEDYKFLPMSGRTIIDVGANICDSSIYFALHGADKVIAIEPFPKNYKYGKKNIEANNLSDKIILLSVGCSNKTGNITINPEDSGTGATLTEFEKGFKIPTMTLEDILNTYHINCDVLKLDCEGCEYDLVLSSSISTLQKFSHIFIEYHRGYNNLKEKLVKANFQVTATALSKHQRDQGHLYAIRIEP